MRVEQNFQLSSSFDRAHGSWTKLSSNHHPHLTVRMHASWTKLSSIILIWPCACELKETFIQIWSLNSHTILVLDWPRTCASNKTFIHFWSFNSHTTLILVWPRACELNKSFIQIFHARLFGSRFTKLFNKGQRGARSKFQEYSRNF